MPKHRIKIKQNPFHMLDQHFEMVVEEYNDEGGARQKLMVFEGMTDSVKGKSYRMLPQDLNKNKRDRIPGSIIELKALARDLCDVRSVSFIQNGDKLDPVDNAKHPGGNLTKTLLEVEAEYKKYKRKKNNSSALKEKVTNCLNVINRIHSYCDTDDKKETFKTQLAQLFACGKVEMQELPRLIKILKEIEKNSSTIFGTDQPPDFSNFDTVFNCFENIFNEKLSELSDDFKHKFTELVDEYFVSEDDFCKAGHKTGDDTNPAGNDNIKLALHDGSEEQGDDDDNKIALFRRQDDALFPKNMASEFHLLYKDKDWYLLDAHGNKIKCDGIFPDATPEFLSKKGIKFPDLRSLLYDNTNGVWVAKELSEIKNDESSKLAITKACLQFIHCHGIFYDLELTDKQLDRLKEKMFHNLIFGSKLDANKSATKCGINCENICYECIRDVVNHAYGKNKLEGVVSAWLDPPFYRKKIRTPLWLEIFCLTAILFLTIAGFCSLFIPLSLLTAAAFPLKLVIIISIILSTFLFGALFAFVSKWIKNGINALNKYKKHQADDIFRKAHDKWKKIGLFKFTDGLNLNNQLPLNQLSEAIKELKKTHKGNYDIYVIDYPFQNGEETKRRYFMCTNSSSPVLVTDPKLHDYFKFIETTGFHYSARANTETQKISLMTNHKLTDYSYTVYEQNEERAANQTGSELQKSQQNYYKILRQCGLAAPSIHEKTINDMLKKLGEDTGISKNLDGSKKSLSHRLEKLIEMNENQVDAQKLPNYFRLIQVIFNKAKELMRREIISESEKSKEPFDNELIKQKMIDKKKKFVGVATDDGADKNTLLQKAIDRFSQTKSTTPETQSVQLFLLKKLTKWGGSENINSDSLPDRIKEEYNQFLSSLNTKTV